MANPEHVALAKHSRPGEPSLITLDLSGADFVEDNLAYTDLSEADLTGANLSFAHLFSTDLSAADLSGAQLTEADLTGAKLAGADLSWAKLLSADFSEADLANAQFRGTIIIGYDLGRATGLDSVVHEGSSSIDIDTLIASFRGAGNRLTPELKTFFLGAGVPRELLDAIPAIVREIKYHSCFISYGEPDRGLAERLGQDLEGRGVSCWLYSMDTTPGEKTWTEIGRRRQEADKMVVLCSVKSLIRDGVKKEIEEQIDEDSEAIIPISLDEDWKHSGFQVARGDRDLRPFLMERNYADFSDPSRYEESLDRLLKALERKDRPVKREVPGFVEEIERRYGKSTMTAKEVRALVDKAMGDKTLTEELFKMREEGY